MGDDVFKLDLALHNNATEGKKYLDVHAFDIEVSLQTGCMKVVFLNKFVQNLLVCMSCCISNGWHGSVMIETWDVALRSKGRG